MTIRRTLEDDFSDIPPLRDVRRYRWLLAAGLAALVLLLLSLMLWNVFFHYVPPGKMLVIISKDGTELSDGRVLAREGEKGIQENVLGEGWHYVKKKMSIFQSDNSTYLRYSMAEKLNEKMVLRLFHSGPGTFWMNMGNKNMNFLLPVPNNAITSHLGSEPKATTPGK